MCRSVECGQVTPGSPVRSRMRGCRASPRTSSSTILSEATASATHSEPVTDSTTIAMKILPQTFHRSTLIVLVRPVTNMTRLMPNCTGNSTNAQRHVHVISASVGQPPSTTLNDLPTDLVMASAAGLMALVM